MEKMTKKEKILLGVSVVSVGIGAGVAGYFGYKYFDAKKTIELLSKDKEDTNKRLNFVEFLVIESDCVSKALQNANNKLTRIQSKIAVATERLISKHNDIDAKNWLENCKAAESKLIEHISKAMELDEAVKADQNIYAK